jgi:hypothetical protein
VPHAKSKLAAVGLSDDVSRIGGAAAVYTGPGEAVAAVLVVEADAGERLYLCAFSGADDAQSWLVLDDDGSPVTSRNRVRDAASIAALCEVAEETVDVAPGAEPRVASLSYLDSVGANVHNGDLAAAIQSALPAVDELARDIEANYKLELAE